MAESDKPNVETEQAENEQAVNEQAVSGPAARRNRLILIAILVISFGVLFWLFRRYMNLEFLAQQEQTLKESYAANSAMFLAAAFLIYVLLTGLSIPGAVVLSLVYAWFFKFWTALILISFASTTGATMAFLISRYLLRDSVQQRFGSYLVGFNRALDREGAWYLFTLRLMPTIPFFVINAGMGLTRMSVATFWWISQIGMLAGTAVYVYAGSRIPDLQALQEQGIYAVFTRSQMAGITVALLALGLFPIVVRKLLGRSGSKEDETSAEQNEN